MIRDQIIRPFSSSIRGGLEKGLEGEEERACAIRSERRRLPTLNLHHFMNPHVFFFLSRGVVA